MGGAGNGCFGEWDYSSNAHSHHTHTLKHTIAAHMNANVENVYTILRFIIVCEKVCIILLEYEAQSDSVGLSVMLWHDLYEFRV